MDSSGWAFRSVDGLDFYHLALPGSRSETQRHKDTEVQEGSNSHLSPALVCLTRSCPSVPEGVSRIKQVLGLSAVITMKQTHSDTVLPIDSGAVSPEGLVGDGAFTSRAGIGLAVKVADCLPVFVYDVLCRCVGIAHCGWRGTAARLAERLVRTMSERLSVPLSDIRFALGPCICPDCYPVGEEVVDRFKSDFPSAESFFRPLTLSESTPGLGVGLDIRAANRRLLKGLGLSELPGLELCTREYKDRFYSARAQNGGGHNLALIALRMKHQGTETMTKRNEPPRHKDTRKTENAAWS